MILLVMRGFIFCSWLVWLEIYRFSCCNQQREPHIVKSIHQAILIPCGKISNYEACIFLDLVQRSKTVGKHAWWKVIIQIYYGFHQRCHQQPFEANNRLKANSYFIFITKNCPHSTHLKIAGKGCFSSMEWVQYSDVTLNDLTCSGINLSVQRNPAK